MGPQMLARNSPPSTKCVPRAIDRKNSLATATLHRPLVLYLWRLARELTDGDFEALVIWCELADGGVNESDARSDGAQAPALRAKELADRTGIPRETVRRKLESLATRGYVLRSGAGWLARSLDNATSVSITG